MAERMIHYLGDSTRRTLEEMAGYGYPKGALKDGRPASSIAMDPHTSARELLNWLRFQVDAGHDAIPTIVDDDGVEYKITWMKKTMDGEFQITVTEA